MNRRAISDALALAFASFFPLVMAALYFVVLPARQTEPGPWLLLAYSIGKVIQFPFPALYAFLFQREPFPRDAFRFKGVGLGMLFGLAVGLVIYGAYAFILKGSSGFARTPPLVFAKVEGFGITSPLGFVGLGVFICLIHSFLEEYYWRWFVFGWMKRHLSVPWSVAISSVGFMLHHIVILYVYFPIRFWTLALPFAVCVAVGGGVWALLYHRSQSLMGPWISHALIDTAILLVGFDMIRPFFS